MVHVDGAVEARRSLSRSSDPWRVNRRHAAELSVHRAETRREEVKLYCFYRGLLTFLFGVLRAWELCGRIIVFALILIYTSLLATNPTCVVLELVWDGISAG